MPQALKTRFVVSVTIIFLLSFSSAADIRVLFLGDPGHHHDAPALDSVLAPYFATRGIHLDYTENLADIVPAHLSGYDALFAYNNFDVLPPGPSNAILAFVNGGKGFIAAHCSIIMAVNDPRFDTLFGGRFVDHGAAIFRTRILQPDHPAMKGVQTFESFDETYIMKATTSDRIVLAEGPAPAGATTMMPWTWVRSQGMGRVYYTASGHGILTWSQPEYQNQLAVAIEWATRHETTTTRMTLGPSPFVAKRSGGISQPREIGGFSLDSWLFALPYGARCDGVGRRGH